MNSIREKAANLAQKVHENQKYAGESYYEKHILQVVLNLETNAHKYFPKTLLQHLSKETWDCIVAAAYLHDSAEDSLNPKKTIQEIKQNFPPLVFDIVYHLTKRTDYSYYIVGILDIPMISDYVRAIKLADLEANIAQCMKESEKETARLTKYRLARYILWPKG